MNEIMNKSFLTEDKFMRNMHLKQPEFSYCACDSFTKHRDKNQAFKEACNLDYIYKNELDKSSSVHDAAYAKSKDLAKRTVSDHVLKSKAYKIALNPQMNL